MSSANEELCDAATSDDVAEIERQIAAGADPNAFEGTANGSPLQRAALKGHIAAIAALLKAGARVDGENAYGVTPLIVAAGYGHTAAIDALVAAGADVHRSRKDGDTALHWASRGGRLDAARVLLQAGARTDVRNNDGKRPIDMVRAPLACSLRLRDRVTSLRRRIAMRRFARW
jgi:ankyrin repeat protein